MRGQASVALAVLLLALAPGAGAEGATVEYVTGGGEGIHVLVDGRDITDGAAPRTAFEVDPANPVSIQFLLSPPDNVTWEIREILIGVMLREGGKPISQSSEWNSTIPPGYTVYVNDTLPLAALSKVGAGLFRMRVSVVDETGGELYRQSFFVRVAGNPVLTASGVVVTAASVATAYGLWQLFQDLKEFYEARQRHKKREAERERRLKLGLLTSAMDVHRDAERIEKRGPIAWSATGLGVGAVVLSWLQFLGYLVFDVLHTLIAAMGGAAAFLTGALLVTAGWRRLHARRVVTVPVQGPPEPAAAEDRAMPPQERLKPRT